MAKRRADTDLNHDNWDREDDSAGDEAALSGVFKRASEDELAKRKIKVARRRSDVVTTGGNEGPSVFKNFSGFGNVATSGSMLPSFDFGAKKTESFGSAPKDAGSKVPSFGSSEKKLFEASSFKIPSSLAIPATSIASAFSFSSTTCNKENSEPSTKKTMPTNGFGESTSSSTTTDAVKEANNTAYLARLGALNEGVLKWIQKHLNDNININLNPVFDDYRKHFDELHKRYKPKFTNKTENTESSSNNEEASSDKNTKFCSSSNSLTSTASCFKLDTLSKSPKTSDSNKAAAFSFGSSESKDSEKPKPRSGDLKPQESSTKLPFLSSDPPKFSFGKLDNKEKGTESGFSFGNTGSKPKESSGFSFGGTTGPLTFGAKEGSTPATTAFSFGSGNAGGFSFNAAQFGSSKSTAPAAAGAAEEDEDAPPKPEIVEVKEEGSVYEKKCKLFYKKDGTFTDKGVGTLFLKPVPGSAKTQLLIRAATNLGNVLLNILLNSKLPTQRMGKNNVLIVCVPNPPIEINGESNSPVSMLIRVKTGEDADEVLEKINEYKGKDK